jgi:ATP-binding cassette, subfamily C (CFTR/MRP), member 1
MAEVKPREQPTEKEKPVVRLEPEANVCSQVFLTWLSKIFYMGSQKQLEMDDIPFFYSQDEAKQCYANFEACFDRNPKLQKELKKEPGKGSVYPMWILYFQLLGARYLVAKTLLMFVNIALRMTNPALLFLLIQGLEGTGPVSTDADLWSYAFGILIVQVLESVASATSSRLTTHMTARVRNAVATKVFRKSLALGNKAKSDTGTGKIVQLMAMDAEQIANSLHMLQQLLEVPILITACLMFVYSLVGPSALVALIVILVAGPANYRGTNLFLKVRMKKVAEADKRIKLTNETLGGIRILKYFDWIAAFQEKIDAIRKVELGLLWKVRLILCTFVLIPISWLPMIMPILVLVVASLNGVPITASKAFAVIAYFDQIRWVIIIIPWFFTQLTNTQVSLRRVLNFMALDNVEGPRKDLDSVTEAHRGKESASSDKVSKEELAILYKNASYRWEKSSEQPVLKELNLSIKKGELVAIVGAVASGKTSLLMSLLGEMVSDHNGGFSTRKGSVAYVAQQPWVMNRTLKNNILMNKPYKESKYEKIIDSCALKPDLDAIQGGDQAEIGERGINLSGGQKARVGFARAVYQDRDIYLLDDPLSAVDAHVGLHMFEKCVLGSLKGKTVLLVTNALQYIRFCDRIVVLEEGKIVENGTYDELLAKGSVDIIKTAELQRSDSIQLSEDGEGESELARALSDVDLNVKSRSESSDNAEDKKETAKKRIGQLMTKEKRDVGDIRWSRYKFYLSRVGPLISAVFAFSLLVWRLSDLSGLFIISEWSEATLLACKNQELARGKLGNSTEGAVNPFECKIDNSTNEKFVYFYIGSSVIALVFIVVTNLVHAIGNIRASKAIHRQLIKSVLRAPTQFFDTTPLGRILSRFSSDMERTDFMVANGLKDVLRTVLMLTINILVISVSTSGLVLLVLFPIGIIYRKIGQYFRSTKTEVQRLESNSKSKVLSNFTETLIGVTSIRAYEAEQDFTDSADEYFTSNTVCRLTFQLTGPWLNIRLTLLSSVVAFSIAALSIVLRNTEMKISAGIVGVCIILSFGLTQGMNSILIQYANLETAFNAVERIQDYADELQLEPANEDAKIQGVPKSWPQKGEVIVKDATMRYRKELPLVLNGLNIHVQPHEKIGICGRTGAGKSSIMVSMFRFVELESGSIEIDGIDIKDIGLSTLRSSITIIPQDPIMYSTTIRENLDPLKTSTDEDMWSALEKCKMKDTVMKYSEKLGHPVAERGDNFSVGERQLFCIARALLRKPKILLLDEATASIDQETDSKIQQTIRDAFADVTVLTIAHRLNTIIDSDRVLVMDAGKAVEFERPELLLRDTNSQFYQLVESMGKGASKKFLEQIQNGKDGSKAL